MTQVLDPPMQGRHPVQPSPKLVTATAFAAGALVANIYYAQAIVAPIAEEFQISPAGAGMIVSTTQIGYGFGLFFVVCLADLLDNRKLVLAAVALALVALICTTVASSPSFLLVCSFLTGLCSIGAQILIPFLADMSPAERRGRVVGNAMAGALAGIMLARPVALYLHAWAGWRTVFLFAACMMAAVFIAIWRLVPSQKPNASRSYLQLLASMLEMLRTYPVLRRMALLQGLMFAAFNIFWTACPLMLESSFGLEQQAIALFALAGGGGALSAPVAGRLADRGLSRLLFLSTTAAIGCCCLATIPAFGYVGLVWLVCLAIVIDACIQAHQVIVQRVIFSISSERRGSINAVYATLMFSGGAIGSSMATLAYDWGGWTWVAAAAASTAFLAFLVHATGRPAD